MTALDYIVPPTQLL